MQGQPDRWPNLIQICRGAGQRLVKAACQSDRMRLSRKSEYACLALIDLAQHADDGYVKLRDICQRKDIPREYLVQILQILRRSRYIKSSRGAEGGYQLSKPASEITLAEIIRLMDGALAPVESASKYFYEQTPIEKSPKLLAVFKAIRDHVAELLERTTFADLA